ncbi:MAG: hypothetical protein OEU63_07170 [Gammaproteobacteria bacterium]|nr:hypothetical protein [Gammaproteobacteria bacterium]
MTETIRAIYFDDGDRVEKNGLPGRHGGSPERMRRQLDRELDSCDHGPGS